ncbi:MAG: energy-coupled thiamine transporter ThiT [Xylanivirga thermophila]|uniref:energy-coupled thiamine transporter ThiT n=1 Tax=Xylanivirga thermophila TaxID=2496273 RepID=UPI001FB395B8|nr:energy-coupled thiamine transporter ThiT [Xylanivirga thermophila]
MTNAQNTTGKKVNTHMLVEGGVMIALAQILSYIKLFEAPYGGSVTAGSMVPIIIFAIRWGAKDGLMAGVIYGILQFLLGPKWSFHPVSIICDYPLAYGFLALAGLFGNKTNKIYLGTFLGILGRFVSHVISGVVVFKSTLPEGHHPLIGSMLYNGAYLLPEFLISVAILFALSKFKDDLFVPKN